MARLHSRKQLLVEGDIDKYFLLGLYETLDLGINDVEIQVYEGKDKLKSFLETFLFTYEEEVDAIGILRDSDLNGQAAFDSVCGVINDCNCGFIVPDSVNQFVGNEKKSGIMIVPDVDSQGSLETLILNAVMEDDCISHCITNFSNCAYLCRENLPADTNIDNISYEDAPYLDKLKFYSYLATQDAGGLIKTAATKGCLKYESHVYDSLKEFITNLSQL